MSRDNRLHNTRGTLAMARTNDPGFSHVPVLYQPALQPATGLDAAGREGYTVFGEVIQGMDIVDFIATAPTGQAGTMGDVPKKAIIINEIVRQQP